MTRWRPIQAVAGVLMWTAATWGCVSLGAPNAAQPAGCQSDSGCKGDRVCRAGTCVAGLSKELQQRIAQGDISTEALTAAAKTKPCTELPGLAPKLDELSAKLDQREPFMNELAAAGPAAGDPQVSYGLWLLSLEHYGDTCGGAAASTNLGMLSHGSGAVVSEAMVDEAVRGHDCGQLMTFESIQLWPFKRRFTGEVAGRKFEPAEVTRRLWLDTLKQFKTECVKRLSRRKAVALDARMAKLERIVGLDDPTLIELRTKLLTAMEAGNAEEILAYTRAVTERETSLDSRNAAVYEAKLRDTEKDLANDRARLILAQQDAAKAREAAAAAAKAGNKPPAGTEPNALDDAKKAIDTTHDAIEALEAAKQLFDM
ncbi:MAG: hypothetical protein JRI68_06625 [Deltaproteobacteria bacterium]|nr:hypothetical protein [Deltaproteobacteria bacterium]